VTIEIPQDSFRLYFRDIPDMPFGWLKLKHGDIVCDKTLILSFLDEAIEKHLIWTMDQITIYYEDSPEHVFENPSEEEMARAVENANEKTIQKLGEPNVALQVFFRQLEGHRWIWMPEYSVIICGIDYIRDLTVAGLEKGVLNDVDRFDVIYKNSKPLPKKMDIDALIAMMRGEES